MEPRLPQLDGHGSVGYTVDSMIGFSQRARLLDLLLPGAGEGGCGPA
jgi:hypothetical protein